MKSQLSKVLQEQKEAEEIKMTPMLDAVFILLSVMLSAKPSY